MRSRIQIAAAVLVIVAAATTAAATTYVPLADEALFDGSPVVLEARIVAIEPVPGHELPAVDYLVEVEEIFKGFVPGSSLIVRVPGGVRPDGVGLRLWGAPRFAKGATALLFLTPRHDGTFALHQFSLGAFHVAAAGRIVYRDLDEALAVTLAGKARPADGVRDLAAFRAWLRDRAAGRERPADYFLPGGEVALPKFSLIVSSSEPAPLGCGDRGGHAVRWFEFDSIGPVAWRFQLHYQTGMGLPDFQSALEAWNDDPNTSVQYLYLGQTTIAPGFTRQDGLNTVSFEDPNDEIGGSFSTGGILALGGPWFRCDLLDRGGTSFHPIIEAEIITQDGAHTFFEALADPAPAARELFAHELGHTLGLAHVARRDALMHALIHNDGRGAAFHVDDLAAAYYLYRRPQGVVSPPQPGLGRPAPPSDLTATVTGLTSVELAWSDNSGDESNFLIERRRTGELSFRTVTTVPSGRTSYADTVEPGTAYTYRVQAQNAAGRSGPSQMVRVEMPEDRRPPPPSNLWAAAVARDRVRLAWRDNSDDETGFLIELKRETAFEEIPSTVPPGSTSVEIVGLTPGTPFTFRMRARNDFGKSWPSNEATATTFPVSSACQSESRRLCMDGGRLAVEVRYWQPGGRKERRAWIVPATDDSAFVWFFHPDNVEIMLRAVELDGTVQVVANGVTNLEYQVVVTDTTTLESREMHHPAGSFCDPPAESAVVFTRSAPAPPRSLRALLARRAAAALDPRGLEVVTGAAAAAAGVAAAECGPSEEVLCLHDGRFSADLRWTPAAGEPPRTALAAAAAGGTGFFSLDDPSRPDVVFKVLDGRPVNGHFWVLASTVVPPVGYEVRLVDAATGTARTYHQPPGSRCAIADLTAFSDTP